MHEVVRFFEIVQFGAGLSFFIPLLLALLGKSFIQILLYSFAGTTPIMFSAGLANRAMSDLHVQGLVLFAFVAALLVWGTKLAYRRLKNNRSDVQLL